MDRQHYKFEMESAGDLMPHLDASPGTSPHRKRGKPAVATAAKPSEAAVSKIAKNHENSPKTEKTEA